jgi:hypothetical protein
MALGCGDSTRPAPSTPTPIPAPAAQARYRVTFEATWSVSTHPDRFPPNPHFSPLVGGTHNGSVRFWETGTLASEGIERMAELGATSPLDDVIRAAIGSGTAQTLILGGGIDSSPGATSVEFSITREYPLVTVVSMIAPSPDWFVGISGRNFLETGDWLDTITFELFPYDAGTDSGEIYDARDDDTEPQEPIRRIEGSPFRAEGAVPALGRFTFTRIP